MAQSLLDSDLDFLDKILELRSIGNELYGSCWNTVFHVFAVFATETDNLPVSSVRKNCSQSMLEKSDNELKQIIYSYKLEVEAACREILKN